MDINGFDPLAYKEVGVADELVSKLLDDAVKATIVNILKSYTGFYDLFAETIQNALDAVEKKWKGDGEYRPRVWIDVDVKERRVRITDNGVGMSPPEFLFCFRPNVSFKKGDALRGQKGVGATFLAYGFNFVRLQSKTEDSEPLAAILRQGRQWAEDPSGRFPRPVLQADKFDVPELEDAESGTSIEIVLTDSPGEKPRDLGWHGATTADQWYDVLRIASPLGGIRLETSSFRPKVVISVVSRAGDRTTKTADGAEYYYPHEIPGLKVIDLTELRDTINKLEGDPQTRQKKLPEKYKGLDCLYDIWLHEQLLELEAELKLGLSDYEKSLIERHRVGVYGAHVHSVKTFDGFNHSLGLRPQTALMRGGLQLATDTMPQGPLLVIPLKRFIGYQQNTHVIVHLQEGGPDLGRKTFQPEIQTLAEKLAIAVTNLFISYRFLLKPDTGATPELAPSRDLQCAVEGALFQWVRIPPGNYRSSRKHLGRR